MARRGSYLDTLIGLDRVYQEEGVAVARGFCFRFPLGLRLEGGPDGSGLSFLASRGFCDELRSPLVVRAGLLLVLLLGPLLARRGSLVTLFP